MSRPAKCSVDRCERSRHGGTALCETHFFDAATADRVVMANPSMRGSIVHTEATGRAIRAAERADARRREAKPKRRARA